MEETVGQIQNPDKNQVETDESVTVAVPAEITSDVDRTLYDAEEFLSNFAGLRDENEQLKQANQELEAQLEKARQDLQQLQLEKQELENQLLSEREENKAAIWKLRSEYQKIQEERLQWKEKYLDACMKAPQQPTDLNNGPQKNKKRKNDGSTDILLNSVGVSEQGPQPEVILTLVSEDSKPYKLCLRECQYCGIGFCSTVGLNHHLIRCEKRREEERNSETAVDCIECNVKFPTHGDLIQHNQYHEGTHPFLCRVCNRAYQSNPGRLKHEQLEHGSMPLLNCVACGRQFKRKDRLKDHIATKHSLETPHECQYCGMKFKLRDYLRKHVHQFHPGKPINNITTPIKITQTSPPVSEMNSPLQTNDNITASTSAPITLLSPVVVPATESTTITPIEDSQSPNLMEVTSSTNAKSEEETISVAKLIRTAEGQNKIVQVVVPAIPED